MAWLVTVEQRGEVDAFLAERTETEFVEIASWLREKYGVVHKPIAALLGVRGAGSGSGACTSYGQALKLDQQIALADRVWLKFSVHGEAYYRRLEFEALNRVIDGGSAGIVATVVALLPTQRTTLAFVKRPSPCGLRLAPKTTGTG